MAVITKESATLNLNFVDGTDATTTWKLDNPQSSVTLAQVTNAVADMWYTVEGKQVGIFVNSNGNELLRLKSAEIERVVKSVEQVL